MREIKFRAWDCLDKRLVYGWLVDESIIYFDGDYYEVDHLTVGQYTGLKDVNGREIYEGDIVKILYCESPLLVTFDSGMFFAEFTNGNVHYLGEHYIGCEVLGNFYENPELWEGNQ